MARLVLAVLTLIIGLAPLPVLAQPAGSPRFACPMACEGEKVYPAAGKCPVCHMDLRQAKVYGLSITGEAKGNEPADLSVKLTDPAGAPVKGVKPDLYVVLRDLASFSHIQPDPEGSFKTTLPPGQYMVFASFKPAGGSDQFASAPLSVSGKAANPKAMGVDADRPKTVDGDAVSLTGYKDLKAGQEATLTFQVTHDGKPVADLGSGAGLVGISPNLMYLIRAQPAGNDPAFKVKFPEPGLYRVWFEFRHGGKFSTVPFVVEVK